MKMTLPGAVLLSLSVAATLGAKKPYEVAGVYTETCSCHVPCSCDLTGNVPGHCAGGGAVQITSGNYGGADLSGVKLATVTKATKWVHIYVDAPDAARRATGEAFARVVYAGLGKIESVTDAKITIEGSNGSYHVTVNGGSTADYTIAPIIGGDGKTAATHGNTTDPLTSTFFQAKTDGKAVFHAGEDTIENASGRNAYFNDKMNKRGEI